MNHAGKKVLVTSPGFDLYGSDGKAVFDEAGLAFDVVKGRQNLSAKELEDLLPNYDALLVGSDRITGDLLAKSRLEAVSKHGIGVDNVDLAAAARLGIPVSNVPSSVSEDAVADFTLALLLSLAKELPCLAAETKAGGWRKMAGKTLGTSILGVVGLGRIGKNVARKARAFSLKVLGWDAFPDGEWAEAFDVRYVGLDELLARADFVTLHVSLNEKTRGLIDADRIALMRPGSFLINTGRGGLVDEKALYDALAAGRPAGAAIDTFEEEPPSGSPLLSLDNVIATPHNASYTPETLREISRTAALNIVRAFEGRPQNLCRPGEDSGARGVNA